MDNKKRALVTEGINHLVECKNKKLKEAEIM